MFISPDASSGIKRYKSTIPSEHCHLAGSVITLPPSPLPYHAMRNLFIYISALTVLSDSVLSLKHGNAQLRDLLAYPKYDVQFLNDLPISSSDAGRAKSLGVEREDEWISPRFNPGERRRLSDGSADISDQVCIVCD